MIRANSYSEVVKAVYGKRWESFPTSKQEDILRMLDHWRNSGEIIIGEGPKLPRILEAIDAATQEQCGKTLKEIMEGPRSKQLYDLRLVVYRLLTDKANCTPTIIGNLFKGKTRSAIYIAMQNFDEYYQYDRNFKFLYDDILKKTDEHLKATDNE